MLHCRQESGQHLLGGKGWGWHKQNLRHLQHVWCWNHSLVTYSWKVSKGLQKTNSRWPKEVLCSLHKDSGVKKRIIMCTLSWEVWRVGHLTLPLSRAGVFWGVCGKGCVCVCVCVCKNLTATTVVRNLATSCEPTSLLTILDYCNRLLTGCLHFISSFSNLFWEHMPVEPSHDLRVKLQLLLVAYPAQVHLCSSISRSPTTWSPYISISL